MIYRIIGKMLHDSGAIRDRVAERIHFENAPAKTLGECIIIRNLSGGVNSHLTNESDCAQPMLQIDFYAASASEAHSGYQLIRNLLSGYSGTVQFLNDEGELEDVRISACNLIRPGAFVQEPRDGSDRWSYRYSADFETFHSQGVPTHA